MADTGAPYFIPYVEPTDLVRDYPAADEASADAIAAALDAIPVLAGIGSNVVQTVKTNTFSTSSTSYVDVTGLAVTITPSSSSSKILVLASIRISTNNIAGQIVNAALLRDSTEIGANTGGSSGRTGFGFVDGVAPFFNQTTAQGVAILDSPATASAVTYKLQIRTSSNTGRVNIPGSNSNDGATSTITVIEVAA